MNSLIDDLNDANPEIRKQAIERAGLSSDDEIADRLIQLVQQPDVGQDDRNAIAKALARMPNERGEHFLLQLISSDDPELRTLAALGLGQLQTEASMTALITALTDNVNTVRNIAERGLISMIDVVRQYGVEPLLDLLNHPVPLTRSPAARVCGQTHDPRVLDPLLQALRTHPDWLSRMWAVKALGDLGMIEALDALAEALKTDEKNRVRAAAAEAISQLRAPGSRELLKLALRDEDQSVRNKVEESLGTLDHAGFEDDNDSFSDD